jgi:hypothetical protein
MSFTSSLNYDYYFLARSCHRLSDVFWEEHDFLPHPHSEKLVMVMHYCLKGVHFGTELILCFQDQDLIMLHAWRVATVFPPDLLAGYEIFFAGWLETYFCPKTNSF